jgi:hypothetical protein
MNARVAEIIARILELDSLDREALLDSLSDKMCMHCGVKYEGPVARCYCMRDD